MVMKELEKQESIKIQALKEGKVFIYKEDKYFLKELNSTPGEYYVKEIPDVLDPTGKFAASVSKIEGNIIFIAMLVMGNLFRFQIGLDEIELDITE
jgi:hypothetical protein